MKSTLKNIRNTIALVAGAILLSSCAAYHNGSMTANISPGDNEFEMISFAEGSSKAIYFLGFGGLDRSGLVREAKIDMYKRYPLKKNQIYANVSVDFKRSFFPIISVVEAVVFADIVQFNQSKPEDSGYQKIFMNLINPDQKPEVQLTNLKADFSEWHLMPGTKIGYVEKESALVPCTVINSIRNEFVVVKKSDDPKGTQFAITENEFLVYENKYLKPNESLSIGKPLDTIMKGRNISGEITALGAKYVLIKPEAGNEILIDRKEIGQ